MPFSQTFKSQNESYQPHDSPRSSRGRMGATPMHHDILLPGTSAPESLSLHADYAAYTAHGKFSNPISNEMQSAIQEDAHLAVVMCLSK